MITPHDVPASLLIEKLGKYLKENVDQISPPSWASLVKTGSHVEKQPQNPDWWYVRCASVFRKIYIHGPIGTEKLRESYGGRKGSTVKPAHVTKAGKAIVRKALQQLETAGFLETLKPQGRRVTAEGRKLLQEVAEELQKDLVKQLPELEKYSKGE